MENYKYLGETIAIELPAECGYEGYSVECTYKYNKYQSKYVLSMWLKHNDVDDKFKIDSQEIDTQMISGSEHTVRSNICRIVEQASLSGFFTHYIERFEYTYLCFQRGNDIFEEERSKNKCLVNRI